MPYVNPFSPLAPTVNSYFANMMTDEQIGFEIWTMQANILFDNIYIGHSIEEARKFAEETFFEKHPIEELAELADKPKEEEKKPASPNDLKFLDDPVLYIKEKLDLFLTIAQKDPIEAVKFVPEIAGGIGAILVTLIAVIVGLASGGSARPGCQEGGLGCEGQGQGQGWSGCHHWRRHRQVGGHQAALLGASRREGWGSGAFLWFSFLRSYNLGFRRVA